MGCSILVVVLSFCAGRAAALDPKAVAARNEEAVVTLFAERDGRPEAVQGSGCCVDASGLVLTVAHAVAGATSVRVRGADGRERPAEVVESDPERDLALVRAAEPLPGAAAVGDASGLRAGSPLLAISAPRGLHATVTAGMVSNADRRRDGRPILQTDLDLAEGSSGGPVFDEQGQLVGVVAARIDAFGSATLVTPIGEAYPLLRKHGVALPEPDGVQARGFASLDPGRDATEAQRDAMAAYNFGVIAGPVDHKVAAYETAVRLYPEFFEAWFNLGVAYTAAGRDDSALAAYVKAEALRGDSPAPLRNRGRLLLRQQRIEEAAAVFERAAELAPDDAGVHNDLGETYRRLGRLDVAKARFERALALRPEYAAARYNLGLTCAALNLWPEAIEHFEAYLRQEPEASDAENVKTRIAELRQKVR